MYKRVAVQLNSFESAFAAAFQPGDLLYGLTARHYAAEAGYMPYSRILTEQRDQSIYPYLVAAVHRMITYGPAQRANPPAHVAKIRDFLVNDSKLKFKYPKSVLSNYEWRRVSKRLIDYIMFTPNNVFFALDGLDVPGVVAKKLNPDGDKSITGSELRKIYRIALKNPGLINRHIIFVNHGQRVPPPWVSDPALWAAYTPKYGLSRSASAYTIRAL